MKKQTFASVWDAIEDSKEQALNLKVRSRLIGKNHQAYLWQYSRPAGPVVFDFRMGREREGPKRFLGDFEGILQSDPHRKQGGWTSRCGDHLSGRNLSAS